MKAEDFVNLVNQSIAPESGLQHITVEDLHRWHEIGFFPHYPEYYRFDLQAVLALLKNAAYLRQQFSQLAQPAQTPETGALDGAFQRGITQVVSCVGSGLIEEEVIIQGLKDTNLIGSAEQIAINFYSFEEVKAAPILSSSFPLMATDSPYFQYLLFLCDRERQPQSPLLELRLSVQLAPRSPAVSALVPRAKMSWLVVGGGSKSGRL